MKTRKEIETERLKIMKSCDNDLILRQMSMLNNEVLLDIRYLLAIRVSFPRLTRGELIPLIEECKKIILP